MKGGAFCASGQRIKVLVHDDVLGDTLLQECVIPVGKQGVFSFMGTVNLQ